MDVAKEILRQLGGGRFLAMTGAKNLVSGDDYLMFSLPAKNKIKANKVKITLNGKDLYDVEYAKIQGVNYKVLKTVKDLHADMLVSNFEDVTGLYTKF